MKVFRMLALAAGLSLAHPGQAEAVNDCHVGAYHLQDGRTLDIGPSDGGTLRWTLLSGETGKLHPGPNGTWSSTFGWTDRPDGKAISFSDCARGDIVFEGTSGERIPFATSETTFESNGTKLVGRLVLPPGDGKIPVVVLVHGSEHDSAVESNRLQRIFPAQGIGAFVYDKRGTGKSGGTYTQNFEVLAADVVAAMHEAK